MVELETDFETDLPDLAGKESEVREALTKFDPQCRRCPASGGKITVVRIFASPTTKYFFESTSAHSYFAP